VRLTGGQGQGHAPEARAEAAAFTAIHARVITPTVIITRPRQLVVLSVPRMRHRC
jgi:hypothetical protein